MAEGSCTRQLPLYHRRRYPRRWLALPPISFSCRESPRTIRRQGEGQCLSDFPCPVATPPPSQEGGEFPLQPPSYALSTLQTGWCSTKPLSVTSPDTHSIRPWSRSSGGSSVLDMPSSEPNASRPSLQPQRWTLFPVAFKSCAPYSKQHLPAPRGKRSSLTVPTEIQLGLRAMLVVRRRDRNRRGMASTVFGEAW